MTDSALTNIQRGLHILVPGFTRTDYKANPDIFPSQEWHNLFKAFGYKAEVLHHQFRLESADETWLKEADRCNLLALQMSDSLIFSF